MICTGPEYVLKDCGEMLYPGDRVIFRGQRLAVSGKESRLEGGEVKTTYILRGEDGFRTEAIYNYRLIGASVAGTVSVSYTHLAEFLRAEVSENGCSSRFLYYNGELLAESELNDTVRNRYILGYGVAASWQKEGYHSYHLDEQNSTA